MATIVIGDFEWHDLKAASNLVFHGVSFAQAIVALEDPNAIAIDDLAYPHRENTLGLDPSTGVLFVVTSEGGEYRTRIISARKATPHEARSYRRRRG